MKHQTTDNLPLVSVVLPTRNREHTLRRAIGSVLDQTYRNLELIVVDDASTDATPALVNEIQDSRIRYVRLDESRGGAGARNIGIEHARGDFIAFQDSDDEWLPEKLTQQCLALSTASDRTGACVCSITYTVSGKTYTNIHGQGESEAIDALRRIARGAGYGTVTLVVKRDVFDQCGVFDERLPRLQDYELTIRIAKIWNLVYVPKPLVEAYVGADSLSSSADKYVSAIEIILDQHPDVFSADRRARSRLVFRAGKYLMLEGRHREALPFFKKAYRADPSNLRALAGMLMVATGTSRLYRRARN